MGLMDEAIGLMKATDDEISRIVDQMAPKSGAEEGAATSYMLYVISSYLNVFATNLSGEEKIYEGQIKVDNGRSCVFIDGFMVQGNVQFELLEGVNWVKGHRENSQYGQIFKRSDGSATILTSDHRGRVKLPLVMDRLELWTGAQGDY